MNRITTKKVISEGLVKFEINTSLLIKDIQPGHYIVLKTGAHEPGVPLAVIKTNPEKETLTVIVSVKDDPSGQLALLNAGNSQLIMDGPFGYPAHIENFGTVICIGRGSGILPLLPVISALHGAGNQVITLLSGSSRQEIILQNEINALSNELIVLTDDGSCGHQGSMCSVLGQLMRNNRIQQVFVNGTAQIIKETCAITTKYNVPTQSVLYLGRPPKNGSHGIFRISNCGSLRSVCVDGYNFNAWYPSFEEMIKRCAEPNLAPRSGVNILEETKVMG